MWVKSRKTVVSQKPKALALVVRKGERVVAILNGKRLGEVRLKTDFRPLKVEDLSPVTEKPWSVVKFVDGNRAIIALDCQVELL